MKTAKNLGFPNETIFSVLYSCEDIFRIKRKPLSEKKELWCIARYIPTKNLNFLCETFLSIVPNERSGWTLNIAGTGELFPTRIEDEAIVHHGFIQPEELSTKLENATAFVLPSLFEPWGVVVHEMATLGKPLILSNVVGAKQDLLVEGTNGYSFSPHSKYELKLQLLKIFTAPHDALQAMGNHSAEIARKNSSDMWVSQFTKMLELSCAG
jgi:glycosyltransferase involved in cell wall biosynthesis